MRLDLKRPLAVFDIEATGTSPRADRIVELAIVRLHPDGSRDTQVFRVNPQMPIPPGATEVHGIYDEDVADCPPFSQIAPEIGDLLEGCDLCGYNVLRFDIPMLQEEFLRAGSNFSVDGRYVLDAQRIFHRKEPRDLSAALKFFCGELHLDAHGALPDTEATIRVLEGELERYDDLPSDVQALDEYCNPRDPDWVDRAGKLKWENDKIVLNFGKKKGTPLKLLVDKDPGFINWMLRSDFPRDMREIVENATRGIWPERS